MKDSLGQDSESVVSEIGEEQLWKEDIVLML